MKRTEQITRAGIKMVKLPTEKQMRRLKHGGLDRSLDRFFKTGKTKRK